MLTAFPRRKSRAKLAFVVTLALAAAWFLYYVYFRIEPYGKGSYDFAEDVYLLSFAAACLELLALRMGAVIFRILFYILALLPMLFLVWAIVVIGVASPFPPWAMRDYMGIFPLVCNAALILIDLKPSRA